MAFVENITSVNFIGPISLVTGRTIVMDEDKYCVYQFSGIGLGASLSIPIDRVVTQGYVYGIEEPSDYCGFFLGAAGNMLSDISGGAIASRTIYAEITNGMSYAPSVGLSITYYTTSYDQWKYGTANIVPITNPYQYSFINTSPYM